MEEEDLDTKGATPPMGREPRARTVWQARALHSVLWVYVQNGLSAHASSLGKRSGLGKDGQTVIEGVAGGGGGHRLGTRVWVSLGWILAEKQSPGEHPQGQKRGALPRFFPWLSRRGRGGSSPGGKARSGSPQFELLGP